ncbi:rho guanine nucleotide exchange factor 17 isoform X1 [Lates japonicus]|uniref:Rho guanine nucleotide exchange factor 17 isoform X1 n=1 Tax=Lates japonicus TaxID=270547 RepID=A0AAD3RKB8_LATJO|nr:rho guanine nucleotide exchange factor 17 isoform X1 [Lates japonicus]
MRRISPHLWRSATLPGVSRVSKVNIPPFVSSPGSSHCSSRYSSTETLKEEGQASCANRAGNQNFNTGDTGGSRTASSSMLSKTYHGNFTMQLPSFGQGITSRTCRECAPDYTHSNPLALVHLLEGGVSTGLGVVRPGIKEDNRCGNQVEGQIGELWKGHQCTGWAHPDSRWDPSTFYSGNRQNEGIVTEPRQTPVTPLRGGFLGSAGVNLGSRIPRDVLGSLSLYGSSLLSTWWKGLSRKADMTENSDPCLSKEEVGLQGASAVATLSEYKGGVASDLSGYSDGGLRDDGVSDYSGVIRSIVAEPRNDLSAGRSGGTQPISELDPSRTDPAASQSWPEQRERNCEARG